MQTLRQTIFKEVDKTPLLYISLKSLNSKV